MLDPIVLSAEATARSLALFENHYRRVLLRTDHLFAGLLIAEWIAAAILAAVVSPLSYSGSAASIHPHVWAAVVLGGLIIAFPLWAVLGRPGSPMTRYVIAAAQLLMTGLIIQFSGGRIETHFLVFGSLAFLAFYRDWRVLIVATLITGADHFIRAMLLPESIYGASSVTEWRTLEHVFWIAFSDVFLITSCLQSTHEMWHIARKRSALEQTKAQIETTVVERTAQLEASQALFQAFMATTPVAAFILDHERRFVWVNRQSEWLLGFSNAELHGRSLTDVFGEGDDVRAASDIEVLKTGATTTTSRDFVTPDGLRNFETTRFLFVDGAGRRFVAGNIVDVTERIQRDAEVANARDAALESTRMKSEFLANMSHEIRTPMNGIIGLSNLVLDTSLTAQQREYLEIVVSSADALLTIINDVLDFSKIEAGQLAFDEIDFDLREAVEGTVELLAPAARKKCLEFAISFPADVPHALRGDSGRLRQVLTNLIGNAIKFTAKGEVRVEVTVAGIENEKQMIRFDVIDTGIGIEESSMSRLFQSFSQADGSITRKFGGTGLGLVIARHLVERMGGVMGVESSPGRGSRFWFTIQAEPAKDSEMRADALDLGSLHILIVDDNSTNRYVLEEQLATWKCRFETAVNGAEALQKLRDAAGLGDPFSIALLDMEMPGMDGLAVARTVHDDAALGAPRIIILSSRPTSMTEEELRSDNIEAFLLKPVRRATLLRTIQLPVSEVATRLANQPVGVVPAAMHSAPPIRLLVVEDNMTNQKVIVAQLKKIGYAADTVANGLEALNALARIPYPLILMDCQMPEMDGFEASRRIRANEAGQNAANPVTIIALTAGAMEGDRDRCLAAGMDDYLTKPIKLPLLEASLLRYLAA
ncbi:MAG TPA: response regulator [Thermoanaerobaculia bacterium]|jgi:PAS domain S-box-containing protein|nr:response regulator [Thermoanaerobaculia bacterium]